MTADTMTKDESIRLMQAEIERLREWQRQMVEKAADKSLAGYRELAQKLADKDEEIEKLRDSVKFLNSFRPDAELARLRGLLREAPCTCPNSPPWDWPHDPNNEDCYLNRVREALGDGDE